MSDQNTLVQDELTPEVIQKRVNELGQWFHNINLNGVQTAPNHFLGDFPRFKWERFKHALPPDMTGLSVLDIGCNAGFYSIEMKRRGAERVVAIDHDPDYLEQARFAARVTGHDIDFRQMEVYQISVLKERFDLVLFLGVMYHLRYPLLALDLIHQCAAKDILVFQSLTRGSDEIEPVQEDYSIWENEVFGREGFPKLHFIESNYSGDPTNWWIPNRACAQAMLRSAGFEVVNNPEREIYICRRVESSLNPDLSFLYKARNGYG